MALTIGSTEYQGNRMTTICIGEATKEFPRHLVHGEKECGYIVQNGEMKVWYWDHISDRDGLRYIVFPYLDILGFNELYGLLRANALANLRSLAMSLGKIPSNFIRSSNGFIETWRFFFIREGGFLFLPDSLSQLIYYSASEQDRFEQYERYVKPDTVPSFALCHQFTQFLYCAAMGFAPYEDLHVREDHWRHIPLSLGMTGLDSAFASWIDTTLSLSPKEQREAVFPAYSAEENLRWWLDNTKDYTWHLDTKPWTIELLTERSPEAAAFRKAQEKRAKRRIFWRKKGALVVSLTLAAVIIFSILGNIIYRQLQPPYTKGMDAPQVIAEFFAAQNELDVQKMSASLANRVDNPYEQEVTALFVNSRVRQAYENIQPVIRADEWLAQGMPPVPTSSIIYGVTDLHIEQIDEFTYHATYRYYAPQPSDDTTHLVIAEMDCVTEFTVTDEKGYYQITSIVPLVSEVTRLIRVETYDPAQGQ